MPRTFSRQAIRDNHPATDALSILKGLSRFLLLTILTLILILYYQLLVKSLVIRACSKSSKVQYFIGR